MSPRSTSELVALVDVGARVKYLHFWGHRPNADGSTGAGCLSQWWPAPFTVDGVHFATAEHFMMWRKAMIFDDEAAARILTAAHPGEAKKLGRGVRNFDESTWDSARFDIVVAGSTAKFGQRDELRAFLLGTGERVLVEASPVDRVWGIGLTAADARAHDPTKWLGLNLLGFALMAARTILRGGQ